MNKFYWFHKLTCTVCFLKHIAVFFQSWNFFLPIFYIWQWKKSSEIRAMEEEKYNGSCHSLPNPFLVCEVQTSVFVLECDGATFFSRHYCNCKHHFLFMLQWIHVNIPINRRRVTVKRNVTWSRRTTDKKGHAQQHVLISSHFLSRSHITASFSLIFSQFIVDM